MKKFIFISKNLIFTYKKQQFLSKFRETAVFPALYFFVPIKKRERFLHDSKLSMLTFYYSIPLESRGKILYFIEFYPFFKIFTFVHLFLHFFQSAILISHTILSKSFSYSGKYNPKFIKVEPLYTFPSISYLVVGFNPFNLKRRISELGLASLLK